MIELPEDLKQQRQIFEALHRLNRTVEDFKLIMSFIFYRTNGQINRRLREEKDDIALRWDQGAGQFCESFINLVENAKESWERCGNSIKYP